MPRRACLELNVIDNFLLRFVDDKNLLGPSANVEEGLGVAARNGKEHQTADTQARGQAAGSSRCFGSPAWQKNAHTLTETPDLRSASPLWRWRICWSSRDSCSDDPALARARSN